MYYINYIVNSIYNVFSSQKDTLIGDTQIEIDINHTCICNTTQGYSPYIDNGSCRFCWGLNPIIEK